jgi:type I restriction enzyme R subunit
MNPEELARQKIDTLLTQCGWGVQDYKSCNLSASRGVALREVPLKNGRCDYLLLVDRKAVGIVEAKPEGTTLSGVAAQSTYYGDNLPEIFQCEGRLPFLYESTGAETFFRDERDPHPRSRRVFAFHRPETLGAWMQDEHTLRFRLGEMSFAHPLATAGMRECQIEAITNLEQSFAFDKPRSLIQMATGAGKTFTACAFIYRLIKFAGV